MRPSCAIHFPLVFPSPFIAAIVNEHRLFIYFFFFLPRANSRSNTFPHQRRFFHSDGLAISPLLVVWNCRLRMQIGYTSVWNESFSWWNHGELIQYCVKFKGLFFVSCFLITESKRTKRLIGFEGIFVTVNEIWINECTKKKKVTANISFFDFGTMIYGENCLWKLNRTGHVLFRLWETWVFQNTIKYQVYFKL